MTARRTFVKVMTGLLALSAALLVALYLVVKTLLAPLPGEWATSIRLGPVRLQASVPALLRLATAPWLAPLLDGRTVAAYNGPVHLAWQADSQTLVARCALNCRRKVLGSWDIAEELTRHGTVATETRHARVRAVRA